MQIVAREAETQEGNPEERLLRLQHLIASHPGKPEWDSPRAPQLVEALILHYAEDLDAQLNQASAPLRGVAPGEWSAYDRSLARSILQPASPPGTRGRDANPSQHAAECSSDLFRS